MSALRRYAAARRRATPPPRPDEQTLAWVGYLDVDLAAAQAALRLPAGQRGWPPGQEPPVPRDELDDLDLQAARPRDEVTRQPDGFSTSVHKPVDAAPPADPALRAPETPRAKPLGAYARRRAR